MTDRTLVEIVEHRTSAQAAEIAADEAAAWLGICIRSKRATVALPGGRTPVAMLAALAAHPINWRNIVVTTTDERLVPLGHDWSNMGAVRKAFVGHCGQKAVFVPLGRSDAAGLIKLPFDLVILGMGADGHIASLFPGSAMDGPGSPPLIEVTPDPLPVEAPVPRRSWSLSALATARRTLLVCTGEAKRAALEKAVEAPGESPLGAFLRRARAPVTIHWAEA